MPPKPMGPSSQRRNAKITRSIATKKNVELKPTTLKPHTGVKARQMAIWTAPAMHSATVKSFMRRSAEQAFCRYVHTP